MNDGGRQLRVLVAARRPFARAGLRELLAEHADIVVVGESPSLADAGRLARDLGADVVLAVSDDLSAGNVAALGQGPGAVPALLIGDAPNAAELRRLLGGGVRGFLLSDATGDEIAAGLLAAGRGLLVLDAQLGATLGSAATTLSLDVDDAGEPLTEREQEVLELLAAGLPNKTIAGRLDISEHTVKFHVGSILGKLGASSRTEAVTLAIRRGLLAL